MCGVRSARKRAAATYSNSASLNTAARTVRAMFGANTNPITPTVIPLDCPSSAAIASNATISTGIAEIASRSRIKMMSNHPLK